MKTRIRILVALTAIAAALGAQSPGAAVRLEQTFNAAAQALRAGDLEKAAAGFQEVLRGDPRSIPALGNLGVVYSRQDRPAEAVKVYRQALRLAPNEPGLLLNLGLAHLKMDQYAEAKPLFADLVMRRPRNRQFRELLATAQIYTGETAPAVAGLERLAREPGDNAGALYLLALGYLKLQKAAEAAAAFEALVAVLPAARAKYFEGRARLETGLFDEALTALRQAYQAEPTLPGLETELGKVYVSLRDADQAVTHLKKALEQNPNDLEAAYYLGAQLVQSGDFAGGAPYLERVRTLRPQLWGTAYYLGKAKLATKKPAEAVALLQEALQAAPGDRSVQYQLGRALLAAGKQAEGKAMLSKLGSTPPAEAPIRK